MVLLKSIVQRKIGRAIYEDTDIIKIRDDRENNLQQKVKNEYLNDTFVKDELFGKFSEFLKDNPQLENKHDKKGVIENWAIWLKTKSNDLITHFSI